MAIFSHSWSIFRLHLKRLRNEFKYTKCSLLYTVGLLGLQSIKSMVIINKLKFKICLFLPCSSGLVMYFKLLYLGVGRQELWGILRQNSLNQLGLMCPGPHKGQPPSPLLFRAGICYPRQLKQIKDRSTKRSLHSH